MGYKYVRPGHSDQQPFYGSWFPKGQVEEFEEYLKGWIGKGNEVKEEESVKEEIMEEFTNGKKVQKKKPKKGAKKVLKKDIKKEVGKKAKREMPKEEPKEDKNVGMLVENSRDAAARYQNSKKAARLVTINIEDTEGGQVEDATQLESANSHGEEQFGDATIVDSIGSPKHISSERKLRHLPPRQARKVGTYKRRYDDFIADAARED